MNRNNPIPFQVVAAFVRLGRKYDIDVVLKDGLRRLYYEYPTTLENYDALNPNDIQGGWTLIEDALGIDINVIKLAHEHSLLSVLPGAFVNLDMEDIVAMGLGDNGRAATLSLVDQRAWFIYSCALPKLVAETMYAWTKLPQSDYPDCKTCSDCEMSRALLAGSLFPLPQNFGPLLSWRQEWERELCSECSERAKPLHNEGRSRFWDALPGAFGFPDWEELKKERVVPEAST